MDAVNLDRRMFVFVADFTIFSLTVIVVVGVVLKSWIDSYPMRLDGEQPDLPRVLRPLSRIIDECTEHGVCIMVSLLLLMLWVGFCAFVYNLIY